MTRFSISVVTLVCLANACSPAPASSAPPGGSTDNSPGGGADGGAASASDAGGGGGSTTGPTGVKSSCAPANVAFGVPQKIDLHQHSYPVAMSSADFNNDGKADLVVLENDGIEALLSTGGGKFGPGKFYNLVSGTQYSITAGNFWGTTADTVAPEVDPTTTFGLFSGKGDGTFGSVPTTVPAGSSEVVHLFAADMNGDHKLDVVFDAWSNSGSGGVLLNAGDGKFASPLAMDMPSDWVVGDLNGDGAADLVSTPPDGNYTGICVKLNTGSGQFAATPKCMPGPIAAGGKVYRVAIGDVNGDGKLDIVGIYDGSGGVEDQPNFAIYLGKGDGTFGDRNLATFKRDMQGFALSDVNNDGKADLVILDAYFDPKGVDVLLSKGDGTFADTPIALGMGGLVGPAGNDPIVADFSGDGLRGIAVAGGNNETSGIQIAVATCKQ
jgi:hypothetical protein